MKNVRVESRGKLEELEELVSKSAHVSISRLATLSNKLEPLEVLSRIKFQQIGCDPLDSSRELNLIEQVNQSFTYLASLYAVRELWERHPEVEWFELNLGTKGGSDVESPYANGIAAEVFASVTPSNNNKLRKDVKKVADTDAQHQYVFFLCPDEPAGDRPGISDYPGVRICSLKFPTSWAGGHSA